MSVMHGVTIVVAGSDPSRLHAALSLGAACAALERPARLFLQAEAVRLLVPPVRSPDDRHYGDAGLPTLDQLLGEAMAIGVAVIVCQSGLALAGIAADKLPPGVETGGLIDLLARHREDQLVMA